MNEENYLDENGVDPRFENDCFKLSWLLENKTRYTPEMLFDIKEITGVTSGIYFLFDKNELVYIGKSGNVPNRLKKHYKENTKKFDSFFWAYSSSNFEITKCEEEHIFRYYPKYNRELSNAVNQYKLIGKENETDLPNAKIYFEGVRLNGKLYIDTNMGIEECELSDILVAKHYEDMKAESDMLDEYYEERATRKAILDEYLKMGEVTE